MTNALISREKEYDNMGWVGHSGMRWAQNYHLFWGWSHSCRRTSDVARPGGTGTDGRDYISPAWARPSFSCSPRST